MDSERRADPTEELSRLGDDPARRRFFARNPELVARETLELLSAEGLKVLRQDRDQARRMAETSRWLAEEMGDEVGLGLSARAFGHLSYLAGRHDEATTHYEDAVKRFRSQGAPVDAAITLSSSIHAQILLGRYVQAFAATREAREIFERHGKRLLLNRLDSNEAQIFMRQGRLDEAVTRYERALGAFREDGEPQDIAAALYNIAVCRIGLHRFPSALAAYRELSDHCARHDMRAVAAQADYNIAYLYFLRGEYVRSLALYRRTRAVLDEVDDPYHRALCDLDQAEIHLELNLTDEGERLADLAFTAFESQNNTYEAAKALTFQAIAAAQRNEGRRALELFGRASESFVREGNRVWPAVIDLYRALILFQEEQLDASRQLAAKAMAHFLRFQQVGKVVLCQLLLARIELVAGAPEAARARCLSALQRLGEIDVPGSTYHAYYLLGQAEEALGERVAALRSYRRAHEMLENLRSHLRGEELKIAFVKDKHEIYESLIRMTLEDDSSEDSQRSAFLYIEQAKSRSLADLVAFRADALAGGDQPLNVELRQRREELSWTYREIDLYELKRAELADGGADQTPAGQQRRDTEPQPAEAEHVADLRRQCRDQEQSLLQALAELRARDAEVGSLQAAGSLDLETLQAAVPEGALLVEYFIARGTVVVALLGRDRLETQALGSVDKIRQQQEYLQFQMSKFQLTPDYVKTFGSAMYQHTLNHLGKLHEALIAPIRKVLEGAERLIFVPHGSLHYLPFHVFWDGEAFLLDRFNISYAPSANVFAMCCAKPPSRGDVALVLGVPDELTPHILGEAEAVAAALPEAELYLGEAATEERLRSRGPRCRWVHIATHGFVRLDNPMFSAIQLGNSRLTLFDLYHLELEADLVVLSGCATGMNFVENGDELIGLTRGLLYAGARSALVTLWNANDASTAEFMSALYRHLKVTDDRAEALRRAMSELRATYPHPYYWAPFVLIGKPFTELSAAAG